MNTDEIRRLIKQELPIQIKEDQELQELILQLSKQEFAPRQQTGDRFDQILAELRHDRETQNRKWDEQNRKWDEQNSKWNEQNSKWDEQNRKWDEYTRKQDEKWDANQKELERLHEEVMAMTKKHDRSIGALGARWGIQSEATFRNALAGILEESFGVQVLRVDEYDDEGQVFGRPDQVELDVIIKNGMLILCELKSSIDKAGMYIFERKVRFYEEKHNRKATRIMVISPMIDPRAIKVAQALNIETYSDSIDVVAD
ncbi:MAG: DUF3782 domain-containing protein [Methylococcales bacterium]